jgi:hypothetical protein
MAEEAIGASGDEEMLRRERWQQAEVTRAIGAAERAGLLNYRVEIAPDGTIAIVVSSPPETPTA